MNSAAQSVLAKNTFLNPVFSASGTAGSVYGEANGIATLLLSATTSTTPLPTVAGFQAVSSATTSPSVTFYVPTGAEVTIELNGTLAGAAQYSIQSSSIDGDPTVTYKAANVVDLAGGYTYRISFAPVGVAGSAGRSQLGSLNVKLSFSPGPEIN